MYDLLNNAYQDYVFQSKAHMNERTAAIQLLKHLDVGPYIVMMDGLWISRYCLIVNVIKIFHAE